MEDIREEGRVKVEPIDIVDDKTRRLWVRNYLFLRDTRKAANMTEEDFIIAYRRQIDGVIRKHSRMMKSMKILDEGNDE